ncbi:hypothetical protein [Clostridium sp. CF012]|uniref:hypothetical protein n=1 Tax=Clostridium sp. CF012 TaxID=2843319 RepID=UPI001C0D27B0|nr:hypothetical protein [Clostridium sp. CF012]MBU3146383.1 hypothetical protein [Clostridium sp. CF012]
MPTTEALVRRDIEINRSIIDCYFREHTIHIENNVRLKYVLEQSISNVADIVLKCKEIFKEINGRNFNVSDNSMCVEILGHVYPDKLARELANWVPAVAHLARYITNRTSVIDIG